MLKIIGICLATAGLGLYSNLALAQATPSKGCFVAHFKSLALKTHSPDMRAVLAEKWLQLNAPNCTKAQLSALQANSPSWLGSSLTQEIASILEGAIEANIAGNPELMARLYESSGKEVQSGSVTLTNPPARAPVVQPMVNTGVLSGSANYGTISGNTPVLLPAAAAPIQATTRRVRATQQAPTFRASCRSHVETPKIQACIARRV